MTIEETLKQRIKLALAKIGLEIPLDAIIIERSKDPAHGDFATNIALKFARQLNLKPQVLAQQVIDAIDQAGISKMEIAGPGFLNFFLEESSLTSVIKRIQQQGERYGESSVGQQRTINIEFVSANPTGDLHLGHARGAAIGDALSRLYQAAGFCVTREYYVNDAGVQINNLGASVRARYHQLLDDPVSFPEDGYHADDIKYIAQLMINEVGNRYLEDSSESEEYFTRRGTELELDKIRRDLAEFRVAFDVFSFETNVRKDNAIAQLLEKLKEYTYVDEGATYLKTSQFGDDKDRVIVKSNGEYTYFLPDIAYHLDKLSRNHQNLIDVLGADHHGYIKRMQAALMMFGYPADTLHVELIQMVRLIKDGEEFKMSKRTGNAITLRELYEDVGVDAVRYFFVARAASSHLDFDLDLAKETSNANPVYYAQYAHARLVAVLEKGKLEGYNLDFSGNGLSAESEMQLLKELEVFPNVVSDAAINRAPYKITNFVQELASRIHRFYTECRIIDAENRSLTEVRLALVFVSKVVLANTLKLIGVSAPDKM